MDMRRCLIANVVCFGVMGFVSARGATNEPASVIGKPLAAEEIVVTGSRVSKDVSSEPSAVYRIDREKEQGVPARTTPDALAGVPSVMIQKTSYGQGSPFMRGFTGFRTLCLIDGIRLNNSVYRDGPNQYWSTVDPYLVGAYEMVMGPSSVLYGSDAVGGTVNAITIAPIEFDPGKEWETRIEYRGATADKSTIGRLQVSGRPAESVGFVGGVTIKDFNDLEGGKDVGRQKHTGYDEQDYDLRMDYHADENSIVTLGYQSANQDDVWRTHKTIYGINWEGLKAGDERVRSNAQERNLAYLKGRSEKLDGFVDAVEWTVSRHVQSEEQYRVKKDFTSDIQGFEVVTYGGTLQFESDTALGQWVYGAEYYFDDVDSYTHKYNDDGSYKGSAIQGPIADDSSYDSLGIYLQDTINAFDGWLDVVPGVRYTYSKADAEEVEDPLTGERMSVEGDWDAVVGSLRLLHPFTADRRHVVYAGVSQGFRAPNLSDLTRLDTARSTEIETPVSVLDPERYIAYEVGFKSRLASWISQVSYHYTDIDSMIVRAPTGRTIDLLDEVTKKNSGDGYVHGVEAMEKYIFNEYWSTWVSGSLMYGKVDAYPSSSPEKERDYISRLMPPTAEAGLRWQCTDSKYWVELVGNAAAKADKLSADDERDTQRIPPGGTPGYVVAHVRTGAQLTKNLSVSASVENILDEDYRIHGSGVNEPGRNFILAASMKF